MDQFCVNHPASTVKHWEFALFLVWHGLCSKGMQAEQLALLKAEPKDKKDAQMKTIALSMIFSLAVIVCEQQTLFAGVFAKLDGLTAANPTNSLVPIAGVNRSVPLSGTSNYCGSPKCSPSRFKLLGAVAIPAQVDKVPSTSTGLFRGCVPMDTDSDDPGLGKMSIHGDEDQPIHNDAKEDVMAQEYQDGAFLPWHRGYIYR
jgi:hypothetical protein